MLREQPSLFDTLYNTVEPGFGRAGKYLLQLLGGEAFPEEGENIRSLLPAADNIPARKTRIDFRAVSEFQQHPHLNAVYCHDSQPFSGRAFIFSLLLGLREFFKVLHELLNIFVREHEILKLP